MKAALALVCLIAMLSLSIGIVIAGARLGREMAEAKSMSAPDPRTRQSTYLKLLLIFAVLLGLFWITEHLLELLV
ncbi:MAG: hypothetical protein ABSH08_19515 [Tepidisphaeraceae bacterium]|jgi:hypothetical protein